MYADSHAVEEKKARKRRTHRKSRQGCRNCKLRRVKCDEHIPICKNCTSFGVFCNYGSEIPDLQISTNGASSIKTSRGGFFATDEVCSEVSGPPIRLIASGVPQSSLKEFHVGTSQLPTNIALSIVTTDPAFPFDSQCFERLRRFQLRTMSSIGPAKICRIYQNEMLRLAYENLYLMHLVQTATLIHDRYLSLTPTNQTCIEIYHLSQAVSLFNQKLSTPLQAYDCDAVWTAASLLGIIAFSLIEESGPEEAWPLKTSSASDLEWVRIGEGKNAILDIVNPSRPGSVLHSLMKDCDFTGYPRTIPGEIYLPPTFDKLYDLEGSENNPYYTSLRSLAPLLHMECVQSNFHRFYSFIAHVNTDLKELLHWKDPRAMLLLAYWYALMCNSQWWVSRRARIECQSISLYLVRYCAKDAAIQELVEFPKMRCGLVFD
ncbi:hypothetical protein MMC17_009983 [Xylographa soralifera]|nr:hypothetical protein [Xylographa soralifera]